MLLIGTQRKGEANYLTVKGYYIAIDIYLVRSQLLLLRMLFITITYLSSLEMTETFLVEAVYHVFSEK